MFWGEPDRFDSALALAGPSADKASSKHKGKLLFRQVVLANGLQGPLLMGAVLGRHKHA